MTDRKYSIWFGRNENFEGSERFLGVLWFMDQKRKYENTRITIYSINQEMYKQQPDDLSLIKKT
jgi:hypothetical protein